MGDVITKIVLVVAADPHERARAAAHLRALGYALLLASSPLEGIGHLLRCRSTKLGAVVVARDLFTTTGEAFLDFVATEFPEIESRFVWDGDADLDHRTVWHAT